MSEQQHSSSISVISDVLYDSGIALKITKKPNMITGIFIIPF